MLVCAFFRAHCTRDRGCSAHPAFPAPSVFEEGEADAKLGRIAPRECGLASSTVFEIDLQILPVIASHRARIRATRWLAMTRKELATMSAVNARESADPVHYGLSAYALTSLEYWITRLRG